MKLLADFSSQENRIYSKIHDNFNLFKEYRLLLIAKNGYFRLHKGQSENSLNISEPFSVRNLKFDRGEIIKVFSQIEFIINEILLIQSVGNISKTSSLVESFLDEISLDRKFEILRKHERVITNKYKDKFSNLKKVRNSFAHTWKDSSVEYLDKILTPQYEEEVGEDVFFVFKKDLTEIIELLLNILRSQQESLDTIERKVDVIIEKNLT